MNSAPPIWKDLKESLDFVCYEHQTKSEPYYIGYFTTLVDSQVLHRDILGRLTQDSNSSLDDLYNLIPIAEKEISCDSKIIENKLLRGYVAVQHGLHNHHTILFKAAIFEGRKVTVPQVEFTVEGAKDAFVESLDINLNLIRKRIPLPELRIKESTLGSVSKTKVAICYIEGITNEQYVNTCIQRIEDVEFDMIPDITLLQQMIEDNSNSIFPQTVGTERPDYVSWALASGQICVLIDGSPTAVFAPVNLGIFFTSYEDYFLPWMIGSILRGIRMSSVVFSIFATPLYVAVLTYHGQGISNIFLPTIISSRLYVPFPPVVEVLIMELVIELLREAGARLPSKIGQTIGIVGGIVLGTAAVEASLTSNFLLMIVALSALASFTTPIFRMSATIRVLRFPFIFAAQLWGILGVFICTLAVVTHLLRLTSLGMPYLVPFYPFRITNIYDSIVRSPYSQFHHRFSFFRSPAPVRFNKKNAKLKKDIDE
ncbi:spore germination protein [Paenibacillus radicis (ex Xue et al. 2023)]|uniref:Spore germination protein n=1 Tax=Paenibacillus radicis (ex Xue et al. 2023) TaxID=2972489 RepID=A0ABT1YAM5_9BACL|nr:spore germination protein [Paenibacillus radicis (ex Xue et al. 2023)]MCR8630248.1 spore germination protein [Paenibacillus radicis (ex Xue et al. 2023)]